MPVPFDNIVQHLFHQPSLLSVTVGELERMTEKYPYFAAAHFLLLKKMQDTTHPQFKTQLQKTTLYFNNPLWLQFLLSPQTISQPGPSENIPFKEPAIDLLPVADTNAVPPDNNQAETATVPDTIINEQPSADNNMTLAEELLNGFMEAGAADSPAAIATEPEPTAEAHTTTVVEDQHASVIETVADDAPEIIATEHAQSTEEHPTAAPEEQPEPFIETVADEDAEAIATEHHPVEETNTSVAEDYPEPIAESFATEENNTPPAEGYHEPGSDIISTLPEVISPELTAAETNTAQTETGTVLFQEPVPEPGSAEQPSKEAYAQPVEDLQSIDEDAADHDNTDAIPHPENAEEAPLIKTIIETPAAKNDVLFEPYHTVDYFASQGIKLSKIEAESKDKFGMQLKSFTEWLKTMKKLPKVSVDKLLAENEESKVVQDANHSIQPKEVITEAMAEVFEKQGLHEKAEEVYRKLSLLNPTKSVYFAARIEALKH